MLRLITLFFLVILCLILSSAQSRCTTGCNLAFGSYYVQSGDKLLQIANRFQTTTNDILNYNPSIRSQDSVQAFTRINVPFSCDCINGQFLGHVFTYDVATVNCLCGDESVSKDYGLFVTYPLRPEDTLDSISSAANICSGLIRRYNPGANFTRGLVYIPGRGYSASQVVFRISVSGDASGT